MPNRPTHLAPAASTDRANDKARAKAARASYEF